MTPTYWRGNRETSQPGIHDGQLHVVGCKRPPPAWLSRAMTCQLDVRPTVNHRSPVLAVAKSVLARMSDTRGNVRDELEVGEKGRNRGLAPLSAEVRCLAHLGRAPASQRSMDRYRWYPSPSPSKRKAC